MQLVFIDIVRHPNAKQLDLFILKKIRLHEGPVSVSICPTVGHKNRELWHSCSCPVQWAEHDRPGDVKRCGDVRLPACQLKGGYGLVQETVVWVLVEVDGGNRSVAELDDSDLGEVGTNKEGVGDVAGEAEDTLGPVVVVLRSHGHDAR